MFYRTLTPLLLAASLALAAPNKPRQETTGEPTLLTVELRNTELNLAETYTASTDGTPVIVTSTTPIDEGYVVRAVPGGNLDDFHCAIFSQDPITAAVAAVATLNRGTTTFDSVIVVAQLVCAAGAGPSPVSRRTGGRRLHATRQSDQYDGDAVFKASSDGSETSYPFMLGIKVDVPEYEQKLIATATVENAKRMQPGQADWKCEAFGPAGLSLGVFWETTQTGTAGFLGAGVVASFLCG